VRKKIFVRGPVLSQSGYGEQSRFALRALRSREDIFDIYILPVAWGKTGWIWEDSEFRRWMDARINLTAQLMQQKTLQPDISLQITIPNEFEKMCPVNFGYTAGIETSKVAPSWLQKGNDMDKILVVSNHAKETYINTVYEAKNEQTGEVFPYKLETPVEVVWENTPMAEPESIDGFELGYDFNFLMVSQMGPRKNFHNSLKWWVEEFFDQEVGLVLKSNIKCNSIMDCESFQAAVKNVLADYPDRKCKVYILHGDLTAGQMRSLYVNPKIKAIVNISHGEGFGLPLYEAARDGLPVVTIGWSGQLDFLTHDGKDYFQNVNYTLQPVQKEAVWDGVIQKESMWAFADQGSYKMTLRKTFKMWDKAKEQADELKEIINEKFSNEALYERFISNFGIKALEKTDYVFVSDLFKEQYIGGAELSLGAIIEDCTQSKTCINSGELNKKIIDFYKDSTWVFGNIADLNAELIQYIMDNDINYHFIEFDYKYCEYRNPELYKFLEDEECDYLETEKGKLIQEFINKSKNTFFMSDEQKEIFKNHLKLENENLTVLSSIFSDESITKIESLMNTEKNDKWIVLGSRSWVKGSQQSEDWCKKNNLDYEVVFGLPYEKMLEKIASSKGVCFKPMGLDTCPRFIIEAKLLGCELELNENVQHVNESWFSAKDNDKTLKYLKERTKVFWETVA